MGFPALEAPAQRQSCSSHVGALQEENGIQWDAGKTLGCALGFALSREPPSRATDDVSTWNDTIPSGRRAGMGLIPAVFPSLPPHGIHRSSQTGSSQINQLVLDKAALGVLLKFQHGESSSGS